jgi:hypothetical protein
LDAADLALLFERRVDRDLRPVVQPQPDVVHPLAVATRLDDATTAQGLDERSRRPPLTHAGTQSPIHRLSGSKVGETGSTADQTARSDGFCVEFVSNH